MARKSTTAGSRNPLIGALALSGLFGAVMFVGLILLGGAMSEGYSHKSQAISELSARNADYFWLQTSNFLIMGVCVLGFAVALHVIARPPMLATSLVIVFGILSSLAQASFPCDEGCEPETATGTAHIVTGSSGFLAILVAMFLLAHHWRGEARWSSEARLTRFLAYSGLVGLIAFNITKGAGVEAVDGLAQRAFALSIVVWLAATSVALYRRWAVAPASDRPMSSTQAGVRTLSR